MIKFKIIIFVLLLGLTYGTLAADGTSGFEFLRTDFSPRSSAMGGAYVAMRGDVNGLFHNPAGTAYMDFKQISANYSDYLLDIGGGFIAYSDHLPGIGQLSASLTYFDYGSFDEATQFAEKTGRSYGANDFAFGVTLADYLQNDLAYGVTVKYVRSSIDVWTASAVALDFGLIYEAPFQDDLFIGVSLMNVGKALSAFVNTKESLPTTLKIGFAKKLAHLPLVLNASINDLNVSENAFIDRLKKFSIGGEFTLSQLLRLRLGYDNDLHNSLKTDTGAGFSGVNIGVGIHWNAYRFDYAFSSFGDLGNTHRFGITGQL